VPFKSRTTSLRPGCSNQYVPFQVNNYYYSCLNPQRWEMTGTVSGRVKLELEAFITWNRPLRPLQQTLATQPSTLFYPIFTSLKYPNKSLETMFFAAALAVAAASASIALAQDVSINDATLTQVSFLLFYIVFYILDSSVDRSAQTPPSHTTPPPARTTLQVRLKSYVIVSKVYIYF
jgi:hypothetical protein